MKLLILSLALCGICISCAAPELERLEDEPTCVDYLTLPQSRRTHPAIDGCQRFLVALREGQYETAFRHLSSDTRKAMTLKAQAVGWQGDDVLRQSKIPTSADVKQAAPFDAVAIFALPSIQTLQLLATPATGSSMIEQRIRIKSANGKTRDITMRFEGLTWRIHNPDLSATEN